METRVKLRSFEELEDKALRVLEEDVRTRGENAARLQPVLFRGQANASWPLRTTLERHSDDRLYSLEEYYGIMRSMRLRVESCTGKVWDDLHEAYSRKPDDIPNAPQGYSFMAYLRHHGFPSPLLDWTRSFYIAAFFAFGPAPSDEDVAIYSFNEYATGSKEGDGYEATIVGVGPCVKTDKRHFLQQCQYTFCKKQVNGIGGHYAYCPHEDVFSRGDEEQDVLTKFVLPSAERITVLDKLRMMNITAYSLFESEDSLLADIATQEFKKRL